MHFGPKVSATKSPGKHEPTTRVQPGRFLKGPPRRLDSFGPRGARILY